MRNAIRPLKLTLGYFIVGVFILHAYFETDAKYHKHHEQIENIDINCKPVIEGASEAAKYRSWQLNSGYIQRQLEEKDEICSTLHRFFYFQDTPLSNEEKDFPLAFGFLVHVDIIQVLLTLSLLYQPQNQYCLTIDNRSGLMFKNILMKLPRCFENVRVQIGDMSYPQKFKMGVMNNVYQCVTDLTSSGTKWEYYQFVASHDVPIKTNLEMVRILRVLNGSINTDILKYAEWRYGIRRADPPPLTLYQGGMGVALPRATADHIVMHKQIDIFLNYLTKTHLPYHTFWATVAGSKHELQAPGTFNGQDILVLQNLTDKSGFASKLQTIEHVGKTSIARLEVSFTKQGCEENPSCYYTVNDIAFLLRRPELLAHKIFMSIQPAAYICLAKELRRKSREETQFDARSYSQMPTVEIYNGRSLKSLTHPDWMAPEFIYEKF